MINRQKRPRKAVYHILLEGNLDPKWADWFDGLTMAASGGGKTYLSGELADQAALHGVLDKINNLGLVLLLVAREDICLPLEFRP